MPGPAVFIDPFAAGAGGVKRAVMIIARDSGNGQGNRNELENTNNDNVPPPPKTAPTTTQATPVPVPSSLKATLTSATPVIVTVFADPSPVNPSGASQSSITPSTAYTTPSSDTNNSPKPAIIHGGPATVPSTPSSASLSPSSIALIVIGIVAAIATFLWLCIILFQRRRVKKLENTRRVDNESNIFWSSEHNRSPSAQTTIRPKTKAPAVNRLWGMSETDSSDCWSEKATSNVAGASKGTLKTQFTSFFLKSKHQQPANSSNPKVGFTLPNKKIEPVAQQGPTTVHPTPLTSNPPDHTEIRSTAASVNPNKESTHQAPSPIGRGVYLPTPQTALASHFSWRTFSVEPQTPRDVQRFTSISAEANAQTTALQSWVQEQARTPNMGHYLNLGDEPERAAAPNPRGKHESGGLI